MDGGQDQTALLERAIAGDVNSLSRLLQANAPRILQYVQRHFPAEMRGAFEPADVVQDACFEACRLIGRFKPQGDDCLYRWLVTIARHRLMDLLRAHRAKAKFGRAWTNMAPDAVVTLLEELALYRRTPSRSAASHEFMKLLEQAIARLGPEYSQVVTLRHIQGLSVAETAQCLGKTDDLVYWLTNRALQTLRAELNSLSLQI